MLTVKVLLGFDQVPSLFCWAASHFSPFSTVGFTLGTSGSGAVGVVERTSAIAVKLVMAAPWQVCRSIDTKRINTMDATGARRSTILWRYHLGKFRLATVFR